MNSRTRTIVALTAAVLLVFTACGDDDEPEASPDPAGSGTEAPAAPPLGDSFTAYEDFRNGPTACGGERPAPVRPMTFERPDDQGFIPGDLVELTVETSCGDLTIELDPSLAPIAVNSFIFLARQGFYDGQISHRIMPGFMFQAGDQTATGMGDAGYKILRDEWPPEGFEYNKGVVAMANAGPASTGSQFFIMLGDYPLPPQYTVIGRVVAGDDTLDAIATVPLTTRPNGEESLPLEAMYIESITVEE